MRSVRCPTLGIADETVLHGSNEVRIAGKIDMNVCNSSLRARRLVGYFVVYSGSKTNKQSEVYRKEIWFVGSILLNSITLIDTHDHYFVDWDRVDKLCEDRNARLKRIGRTYGAKQRKSKKCVPLHCVDVNTMPLPNVIK